MHVHSAGSEDILQARRTGGFSRSFDPAERNDERLAPPGESRPDLAQVILCQAQDFLRRREVGEVLFKIKGFAQVFFQPQRQLEVALGPLLDEFFPCPAAVLVGGPQQIGVDYRFRPVDFFLDLGDRVHSRVKPVRPSVLFGDVLDASPVAVDFVQVFEEKNCLRKGEAAVKVHGLGDMEKDRGLGRKSMKRYAVDDVLRGVFPDGPAVEKMGLGGHGEEDIQ